MSRFSRSRRETGLKGSALGAQVLLDSVLRYDEHAR